MAHRDSPLIALIDVSARMGGVEFSTLYLAQRLDPARFRRLVVCPEEGDLPDLCRKHNIPVEIVPQARPRPSSIHLGRWVIPNPIGWLVNLLLFIHIARRLTLILRARNADLVCTKGLAAHFYGGLAARWAGIPCVWHVQDFVSERFGQLYPFVLGMVSRVMARYVIADGTPIKNQLGAYAPAERISVVYNGVDTSDFSPSVDGAVVRTEWGIRDETVLIGNVARFTPWKGQDCLIEAFAQVAGEYPNSTLVLVGAPVFDTEAFERHLKNLVNALGLKDRVVFAGFRWDLPEVMAALDIYVHPSIEKDTSPLAVVCAIASGKAIVATSVPGVAELFNDGGDGLLVPPRDPREMANRLSALLSDAKLRQSLGQAARCKAEAMLSLDEHAQSCQRVFERCLLQ